MSSQAVAAATNRPQYTEATVRGLRAFNDALAKLNIRAMTAPQHDNMLANSNIPRIHQALLIAHSDGGAFQFLSKVIDKYAPAALADREPGMDDDMGSEAPPSPARAPAAQSAPDPAPAAPTQQGKVTDIKSARQPAPAPASQASNAPSPAEGAAQPPRERYQEKAYGGKGALHFEAGFTKNDIPTVYVEAAPSTAPQQYDWSKKIIIQLTRDELPAVAAVFCGLLPKCDFSNHGEQNNKGFSFENQTGKIFGKVRTTGVNIAVPIGPGDAMRIGTMMIHQLRMCMPQLKTAHDVITMLRATYVRLSVPARGESAGPE